MSNARSCPVCKTPSTESTLFQEENIDKSKISDFSYASRKTPEFMCLRLVKCNCCDLVYASNPPSQDQLAQAYHIADYDSSEEANDAAEAYMKAMQPILKRLKHKSRVLEIGSGTGVLLDLLKKEGFQELIGIEPSSAAIAAAPVHRKKWLQEGIFIEDNFEPESFDLICCFMTMEHVQDPMATALSASKLLRNGGAFVTVTHDYKSLINRILGNKSPIIDIEHMQLFSEKSIVELYKRSNLQEISAKPFKNVYSLRYWLRLSPIPVKLKELLLTAIQVLKFGHLKIGVNVGNTMAAGFKRDAK